MKAKLLFKVVTTGITLLVAQRKEEPSLLSLPDIDIPGRPERSSVEIPEISAKELPAAEGMPTTEETVLELRGRLGKELYRLELDLLGGGRIAGKPCDCLSHKHHFGIEATAEELMAMDNNPVYNEIIDWMNRHKDEFDPKAIGEHPPEYYQGLVPEFRKFRKRVMGTE